MKKRNSGFHLTISHYKILQTIQELNAREAYPTVKGVSNILKGRFDEDTKPFVDVKTFGTLISFQGRKMCSYVLNMVRRGYLTYIYDEPTDEMYLRLTEKGEGAIFEYERKHKRAYRKKTPKKKPCILTIKK